MATVCVPHFAEQRVVDHIGHGLDELKRFAGILLVDDLDGKPGVHEHVVANSGLWRQVERRLALGAHGGDAGHAVIFDFQNLHGNCQAHNIAPWFYALNIVSQSGLVPPSVLLEGRHEAALADYSPSF